jgi:hypothetical protein
MKSISFCLNQRHRAGFTFVLCANNDVTVRFPMLPTWIRRVYRFEFPTPQIVHFQKSFLASKGLTVLRRERSIIDHFSGGNVEDAVLDGPNVPVGGRRSGENCRADDDCNKKAPTINALFPRMAWEQ